MLYKIAKKLVLGQGDWPTVSFNETESRRSLVYI